MILFLTLSSYYFLVKKNLNPEWKRFEIFLSEAGGWNEALLWECYDYDSDGSHDFIGKFTASLQEVKLVKTKQKTKNKKQKTKKQKTKNKKQKTKNKKQKTKNKNKN